MDKAVTTNRSLRRFSCALAMVALLGSALPAHAADEVLGSPEPPVVTSTTVIQAEGSRGIQVTVPPGVSLSPEAMRLQLLDGGGFAYAMLAQHGCTKEQLAICRTHDAATFSTPGWSEYFPDQAQMGARVGSDLQPGVYDIYIVTDRSAELTLPFEGAPTAATVLQATGEIDAALKRLPTECPAGATECAATGYGSATHKVEGPGLALVAGFAYRLGAGQHRLATCIDPWFGAGSAGTAKPAFGCPVLPSEPTSTGWTPANTLEYVQDGSVSPTGGMRGAIKYNNDPDGNVMVGYMGSSVGTEAAGYQGWGIWLHAGIR